MLLSFPVAAQEGFALNRFEPADRGSDWFITDSLDYRGELRPHLGVTGDWGYKPLVWYRNGEEYRAVIRHQVFAHVGAALVIEELLRVGVSLPVLAYQKGMESTVGGLTLAPSSDAGVGDLRISASIKLLGEYRGPFSLAFGAWGFVPTGSEEAFTSDGGVRLAPRVMMAGDIGTLAYAFGLGGMYRGDADALAGGSLGSEVFASGSLGLRLADGKWLLGPEFTTSTVVSEGDAAFSRLATPFEALLGLHFLPNDNWKLGVGAGPGMTRGFGSPTVRGVATIEWSGSVEKPAPARKDTDRDGIYDDEDACVEEPGVRTEDPATNGCPEPEPKDTDGDGILDSDDACVDEKGKPSDDPKQHGCPERDTDGDGILDSDDACVDEKGKPSDDPKQHGCPERDTDGDGILDSDDACPKDRGPANDDPKKHGCPKVVVEEGRIRILERVEFETGKARILPESEAILSAVKKVLDEYPKITRVSVEGHTDSRSDDTFNLNLSRKRAAAVVKWLVSRGIEAGRLTSQGFGETKPIDTNDTDQGRQNNRRVEFKILEEDGKTISE